MNGVDSEGVTLGLHVSMGSVVSGLPAVVLLGGRKGKLFQLPAGQIYNQAQLNKHPDWESHNQHVKSAVKTFALHREMGVRDLFAHTKASLFSAQLRGKTFGYESRWMKHWTRFLAHLRVRDGRWIPVSFYCVRLDECWLGIC